ncbi:hypothetical protein L209DRAFT_741923 [Thermothelomyces heterothallicus CBS 203.75]
MVRPYDPTLTETAVRVDPRDSREYAGNQEASPLYDICHHPEKYTNVRYFDREMVVLDDANAKSPDHVILMPRDTSIKEMACLKTKHLPLLYRFRDQAHREIERMMRVDPGRIPMFRVGFHTIPSLFPLHCHVHDCSLSTDKMFHARHWKVNFSNMFVALDRVIEEIERTGRIEVDADAHRHDWRTRPIRCPVCPGRQPQWEADITELAAHWRRHVDEWKSGRAPLPPNVTPARLWEPSYPVILTTRRRSGFLGLLGDELDHLKAEFPGLEIHSYYTDEWPRIPKYVLDKTTIYLSAAELPPPEYSLPRLEWVHLGSSGLDLLAAHPYNTHHHRGLCVTSSTGSGSEAVAEWVLMNTMFLTRRMGAALRNQAGHEWAPRALTGFRTISQLSIGIVGFGSIGRHVAERFLALGARKVTAVNTTGPPLSSSSSSPCGYSRLGEVTVLPLLRRGGDGKAEARGGGGGDDDDDDDDGKHGLREFLRDQDVLVLAAPLTPETRELIGGAELAALPRGAVVLNVARGPLLDERALVERLRSGHLAGAAIDVADQEPLDAASPLWDVPNLVITPHVSAFHSKYNQNMLAIFEHNLRAHLWHRPVTEMRNVVQLPVPSEPSPLGSKSNAAPKRPAKTAYAVKESSSKN